MRPAFSDSARKVTRDTRLPFLTEEQIVQWIKWFREKEGRSPTEHDKIIWGKNSKDQWVEISGASWNGINQALRRGWRGLNIVEGARTLAQLKDKHGLNYDNPSPEGRQRPPLTEAQIVEWMELFHEKEGRWPTDADGKNVWIKDGAGGWARLPDEHWHSIGTALRKGFRGLRARGVPTSVGDLKKKHDIRSRSNLTEAKLIRWIKLFREKEGRWPGSKDKTVWDKDQNGQWVKVPDEHWTIIDTALTYGRRGTPQIEGGLTLLQFRDKHDLLDHLTEAQIVEWIKLYHEKEGRWPTTADAIVWDKDENEQWAIVPDERWDRIDASLRVGSRGLGKTAKSTTLRQLRNKLGLSNDYTEAQIVEWIKLYREKEGNWPTDSCKIVWEKDTAGQWTQVPNESWSKINSALKQGLRGLNKIKGIDSLAELKNKHSFHRDLTESQIVEWIKLYHEKEGRWPAQADGIVWSKDGNGQWVRVADEHWRNIDQALFHGNRGLANVKDGKSLTKLKNKYGLTDRRDLTESLIVEWIKLFREKEGRWPISADQVVWSKDKDGRWTQERNESWKALDTALYQGHRGLAGGESLVRLRERHALNANFTEAQIVEWIKLFHEKEGRWPVEADKVVWSKNNGQWVTVPDENWEKIDTSIKRRRRGLQNIDVNSLKELKNKHDINNHLTEAQIVEWVKLFHEKEGRWPVRMDPTVWKKDKNGAWLKVPNETWVAIDGTLKRKGRGLAGTEVPQSLPELKKKHGFDDGSQPSRPAGPARGTAPKTGPRL